MNQIAQFFQTAGPSRSDASDRHLRPETDLNIGGSRVLEVEQAQETPATGLQGRHAVPEFGDALEAFELGQGVRGRIGEFHCSVALTPGFTGASEATPSLEVDRQVIGHGEDPGAEPARVPQGVEGPEAGHAGLLEEIVPVCARQARPGRHGVDEAAVGFQESPPGGFFPATQAVHESRFIHPAISVPARAGPAR